MVLVIVSWNTRELLGRCLASVAPDIAAGRAEPWVVDNASVDGSAAMVRERFPEVRLVASDHNLGFGPAVNVAAARTTSRWLAAANADVEFTPGALEALLATGEASAEAGAVAPRLVMPTGATQHSVHPFPTLSVSLLFNLGLTWAIPPLGDRLCIEGRWDPSRARRVDWAHGACLLLRREAFAAVGGFDEGQWMYAEDLDLAWRLRRAGWCIRYEPAAVVGHEVGAAADQAFAGERAGTMMRATHAWMVRRRGVLVTWAFAALNLGGAATRLLLLALPAAVSRRWAKRKDATRRWLRVHRLGLRRRATILREAPAYRSTSPPGGHPADRNRALGDRLR